MSYPNILIVTSVDIFSDNSSSSMTVKSFFEEIPQDKIFQLICVDSEDSPRGGIGNNYYLNRRDIICYPRINSQNHSKSGIIQPIDNRIANKSFSFKHDLIVFLKDALSVLPYKFSKGLQCFLQVNQIQIIYTCSFNPRCYNLIDKIYSKINIPHVAHFLDDWPNIQYVDSFASRIFRNKFNRSILQFIQNSPFALCISELMCSEYKKRYRYSNFYPLMHSVDEIPECKSDSKGSKKIIYAGSLYLERYVSILEFCKSLQNEKNTDEFEIIIYTHKKQWDELAPLFKNYKIIKYGGFISHEELMISIQHSYALLFVESLKESMLEYTRLSMSTKIPEFLSSGKPIFAIGHEKQGSISYLKEYKAAYVATDLCQINNIIRDFIDGKDLNNIVSNARNLFIKNHQKINQKHFFLSLIKNTLHYE